jgi:hypothetical protein
MRAGVAPGIGSHARRHGAGTTRTSPAFAGLAWDSASGISKNRSAGLRGRHAMGAPRARRRACLAQRSRVRGAAWDVSGIAGPERRQSCSDSRRALARRRRIAVGVDGHLVRSGHRRDRAGDVLCLRRPFDNRAHCHCRRVGRGCGTHHRNVDPFDHRRAAAFARDRAGRRLFAAVGVAQAPLLWVLAVAVPLAIAIEWRSAQ